MAELCGGVLWLSCVEVSCGWLKCDPNKIFGTQEISKCRQLVVLPVLLGDVFPSGWGLVGTPDTNKFCLVREVVRPPMLLALH